MVMETDLEPRVLGAKEFKNILRLGTGARVDPFCCSGGRFSREAIMVWHHTSRQAEQHPGAYLTYTFNLCCKFNLYMYV